VDRFGPMQPIPNSPASQREGGKGGPDPPHH